MAYFCAILMRYILAVLFVAIELVFFHLVVIRLVLFHLVVLRLVFGLLVVTIMAVGLGDVHLGVDQVIALDVGIAGESDPPVSLGVVVLALLLLAVVELLAVVVLILNLPVKIVVRDVGVVDVLLAVTSVRLFVSVGGGNSGESQENDSDLKTKIL